MITSQHNRLEQGVGQFTLSSITCQFYWNEEKMAENCNESIIVLICKKGDKL
jgi:hypothetical protein